MWSGRSSGDSGCRSSALATRLLEDPGADRDHEARLLRQRDEVVRTHEPSRGVVPTDERLEPLDRAARQVDHRLEQEHELLVVDRPLEIGLQLEAAQRRVVHLRFEDLIPVLAGLLGDVHRDVGVAEELLRALRSQGL